MDFFTSFFGAIKERLSDPKTGWGRWIGALVIIDILGVWTYACIQKKEMVPLDNAAMGIVLTIFVMNGIKAAVAKPADPKPPEPSAEI
jgi:hypothetical protein